MERGGRVRTAVLLAAGRGRRLGALTETTPKPLLYVGGRPILAHILSGLAAAGVERAVVVIGHLGEQIEAAFGAGAGVGLRITYRRQEQASGTAHALLQAQDAAGEEPFFLGWGDILVEHGFYRALLDRFAQAPCDLLVAVNRVDDPCRGAAVNFDENGRVTEIVEKPPRGTATTPWNNAGLFVCRSLVFAEARRLQASPRGEYELPEAFAHMVRAGRDVRAHPVRGLWTDVGTPADLERVRGAVYCA